MSADAKVHAIVRNVDERIRTKHDLEVCGCADCRAAVHILSERTRMRIVDRIIEYAKTADEFSLSDLKEALPEIDGDLLAGKLTRLTRQKYLVRRKIFKEGYNKEVFLYRMRTPEGSE